jgi:uncharacterized damage-inducible protein DinB
MARSSKEDSSRSLLLRLVDEAFDRQAWHGPNLRAAVRRVTPELASWRPKASKRSIAEIVVHCAYWKYAVRRRIVGGKRGSFALKGSNWFALPDRLTGKQWQEYVRLLDDEHAALRETLASAPWSALCGKGGRPEPAAFVLGIAMHDTYHAGQIRTLKAMHGRA